MLVTRVARFASSAVVVLVSGRKFLQAPCVFPAVTAVNFVTAPLSRSPLPAHWGSKTKNKKKLKVFLMADPEMEKVLAPLRAAAREQVGLSNDSDFFFLVADDV